MSALNEMSSQTGGKWVKLDEEGAEILGHIISTEKRERTDPEGNVIKSRKTGQPRYILRVTLATDDRDPEFEDDEGVRIFDANETAQREIVRAYKEAGLPDDVGAKFWIKCTKVTGTYEQNEVKAKFGEIDRSKVERFVADNDAAAHVASAGGAEEPF